jgi:2-polyprenyl-6-methoxyphenol hydroxylase-like FAD-dependent oxidoreductase
MTTETAAIPSTDLLVIGGGPTGLTAAVDALRHGLTVRIVERRAARAEYSKALVVHARTMEVFERLGCAEAVLKVGAKFRALHVHTIPGRRRTRVDLLDLRWGDTRYPHWLSVPQYEVERALEGRLAAAGAALEWSTELLALEQRASDVVATLRGPDGVERRHVARWVLGCDGGRSTTRDLIDVAMRRTELGVTFALADVMTDSPLAGDEGHVVLADEGLLLIVPMPAEGVWRLIAQVDDATPALDAAGWDALVTRRSGFDLKVRSMGWSSRFRLASGVSEHLRRGRVFLLGDAAHVHSPVGGQGLNTGVHDAHNLIWKLALVDRPELAPAQREPLLDSYAAERHAVAQAMVTATERMTRLLTGRRRLVFAALRRVAPLALSLDRVRNRLGRGVGMLDLRTGGRPRLANPEVAPGVRLHDRVTSLHPTLLRWDGREVLVRPDLIVANPGELPHLSELRVDGAGSVS